MCRSRKASLIPVLLIFITTVLAIAPSVAQASKPTLSQAVDILMKQGYAQRAERHICSLGDSPLGFRTGGSTADLEAGLYWAAQMRLAGVKNVHLEPITMDAWEFRGASVKVGDRLMQASSFTCIAGTPRGGITGQVVYAGRGTAAEFDALGDVSGKIVLMDFTDDHSTGSEDCWSNCPSHEATLRGATALIFTTSIDATSFFEDPKTLGGNDGEHDPSWAPLVYIGRAKGDWLKARIAAGPTTATVKLNATLTLGTEGGTGYNVMGVIPGRVRNGEKILFVAHHDAFFQGAVDNTTAVVAQLVMARAIKMAGYTPRRTIVFLSTTGEEGGQVDTWYDWCYGAWYSATQIHPNWPGKVAGVLNVEGAGSPDGQMYWGVSSELLPLMQKIVKDNPKLVGPDGPTDVYDNVDCGSDQWPFNAAGIPAVALWASADSWYSWNYHTPNDSVSEVDWAYFASCTKMLLKAGMALDRRLLPYDLSARAAQIESTVDEAELIAAGAAPSAVERLAEAVAGFKGAATAYDARAASIPSGARADASSLLMKVAKEINRNFTALDWGDNTVYPHQQVLWDLQAVNSALAALQAASPDPASALGTLSDIGFTWYGLRFSPVVYYHELNRHDPDYWAINWAGQGHLPQPIDVLPAYRAIEAGDLDEAVDDLQAERDRQATELDARLNWMAAVLEPLPEQVAAMH
jgi:hypothetical protein